MSVAMELTLTGTSSLTSSRTSIFVGSSRDGRMAVIAPAFIPPNRTGEPVSTPPAYLKYVLYGMRTPRSWTFATYTKVPRNNEH